MARPTNADLIRLITFPNETLTVEHKVWLDFSLNPHKAILAKAAIALANEGGGIIVLGTREDSAEGGKLGSIPRPSELSRYSLDDINSVITKFSDPSFHCELLFAEHPDTKVEHAFVIVPGGMTVPVMSRRGSDGEIQQQRCYVRKPGPKSEEPFTAEEWRGVLERCLQARRETMLDAIRTIVQGHGETPSIPPSVKTRLTEFMSASETRWKSLIDPLPNDDPARMPYGHYEIGFSFLGSEQPISLTELRKRIDIASSVHLTGWPPFLYLHRIPYEPRPIGGAIETWLGNPGNPKDDQRLFRDPVTSDFWRIHPAGDFFMLRGYDEDSSRRYEAGKTFNVRLPIWRLGEILLFASRIAKLFGDDLEILVKCQYYGLLNRQLIDSDSFFSSTFGAVCLDDAVSLETQATIRQIEDNLVEVLQVLLHPLYERFSFFELTPRLVTGELERLRSGRL